MSESLSDLAKTQVPYASRLALNRVMSDVLKESRQQLARALDRPTPYALRAFMGIPATKSIPYAEVKLRQDAPSKGTPWANVIGHHHDGGDRPYKKIEGAFLRLGVLNRGWIIVPGSAAPLDGYGNVPVAFQRTLISYFKGFSEQGFRANMNDKRKAKMADKRYHMGALRTNGVEYFISRGRGQWFGGGSWQRGMVQHLAPGIYSRTSIHGCDIKPVLMFVRKGRYRKRIDLPKFTEEVVNQRFNTHFRTALQQAIRTAK